MRVLLLLLTSLLSFNVAASNFSFLNNSPITFFQGNDETLMKNNIVNALNSAPDNKKSSWNNPETGARGYVIVSDTKMMQGKRCRNIEIFNEAKGENSKSHYEVCKYSDGWKYVFPGQH